MSTTPYTDLRETLDTDSKMTEEQKADFISFMTDLAGVVEAVRHGLTFKAHVSLVIQPVEPGISENEDPLILTACGLDALLDQVTRAARSPRVRQFGGRRDA